MEKAAAKASGNNTVAASTAQVQHTTKNDTGYGKDIKGSIKFKSFDLKTTT